MKLHTCLTDREVGMALERAQRQGRITQDMQFAVFTPSSSLTHPHGYEIQLGTYDQDSLPAGYADQNGRTLRVRRIRGSSQSEAKWAATWHEWGWLIAEIFAADPGSRWGANPARSRHPWGYFNPEDFHAKTNGQFRTSLTLSDRSEHLQEITMTTLHAFREDGTEVLPGETVPMAGVGHPFTFRTALIESNDSGTSGMIAVDGYPDMFSAPFGLTVRAVSGRPEDHTSTGDILTMTLKAYNADGTEVQPGDTIVSPFGSTAIFRAALRATEAGRDGSIQVDGPPGRQRYSARLFGLHVSLVDDEPAWHSAGTADPGDIRRDIRGPGGFQAIVGSRYWMIIDFSDGETVISKITGSTEDGKQAVLDWEREHGLVPETWVSVWNRELSPGAAADQPETTPGTLEDALAVVDAAQYGTSYSRETELAALRRLASEVRSRIKPAPDADEMAAEADRDARQMAPPVPGVTQNTGHTVYAVIRTNHVPGEPSDDEWVVAAANDREHVTWTARTCEGGTLAYDTGHYHAGSEGSGSGAEALVDLASRAGIFRMLTDLSSGTVARAAFQDSHARVLDELAGAFYSIGRARIRAGLLEAAALGYARVSWHAGSRRQDYGIRYDRVGCVFTWAREN